MTSSLDVRAHALEILAAVLSAGSPRSAYERARDIAAGVPSEDLPRVAAALAVEVALRGTTRRDRGLLDVRVIKAREGVAQERAQLGRDLDGKPSRTVVPLSSRRPRR